MKRDDIYDAWKRHRSRGDCSGEFVGKVMAEVGRCDVGRAGATVGMARLVEMVSANGWARAALVAAGAAVGAIRVASVMCALLAC